MKPLIPDFFPLQTGATHSIPPEENLGTVGAPVFLHNDPEKDIKVLNALQDELQNCREFAISVAFITDSGIAPLLLTLEDLEKRGIPGRILTTDYLCFTNPRALRKLNSYHNIEVRLFRYSDAGRGFHTKGYIFENPDLVHIIIGSSNWTNTALTTTEEWNTKLILKKEGRFAKDVFKKFEALWKKSQPIDEVIDAYEAQWTAFTRSGATLTHLIDDRIDISQPPNPNSMQREFLKNLQVLRDQGKTRALLISATGTGKTYAAAFAVRQFRPKRVLFLVHREQIAKQALKSFRRVLGDQYNSYGLLSGNSANYEAQCLFSTMQTMAKSDVHHSFSADAFDFIIIDEVHRAGAPSYQTIMNYFRPAFWLGMTASPERTDDFNIFSLFDHNIAYEIRLQTALGQNLLCPFHYFGITDLAVDQKHLSDLSNFQFLTSDERVKHILERAEYFGYSGSRVKGLIFCSSLDECEDLSKKFNAKGYQTLALSGDNTQDDREKAIERLTQERRDSSALDYILTVDIFNEGVDIPEINQVLLLRPTQSPIIFLQQLGRGLRKADGKDYVIVLDFIANYKENYLIPVALSGDRSYDKDTLRRFVAVEHRLIPGSSTIEFDSITKEKIFEAIDRAQTQSKKLLREAYTALKFKLGHRPTLQEFEDNNSIDVIKYFDVFGSYYSFLKDSDTEFKDRMSLEAETVLTYFSSKVGRAQRISEVLVLEDLLAGQGRLMHRLAISLSTTYHRSLTQAHRKNVTRVLTNQFCTNENIAKKYAPCVFIEKDGDGDWKIARHFAQLLHDNPVLRDFLSDLASFMKRRFTRTYAEPYGNTEFVLNEKYSYEDVCRLLNWENNVNGQNIGGYKYDEKTKTLPVFINYKKDANAISYEDQFQSRDELIALSKTNRRVDSKDAKHIYKIGKSETDNRIYLFMRRDKNDKNAAKYFYFLGEIEAKGPPTAVKLTSGEKAFEIHYHLKTPVRQDLYDYLTTETQI